MGHDHWVEERLRRFKFPTGVQQLLQRLAASYKLAIITNGPPEVQRAKLSACDADALFGEKLLVSGEQPHGKPHPSIFHTACKLLDAAPGEAVMVGDSLVDDIQGGTNAG